ncbi:electron transfer flavoprotein subunit beta/FixA family protein [Blautia pseudococcoides]|nr:electron transfer flavoprotein subunit beta/FixA family protein [Blautia pseudococcoides]
MNFVVCVKQVPVTQSVQLDKNTNNIIRDGVESQINPFDSYAVEEAILLKEKMGGQISVLSMGLPSVEQILRRALAVGCDEGILLTDHHFAGSDTLATSYALSLAIKKIQNVDLVICGKQAIDGDTAQVGPSLAEQLHIPHITCVQEIVSLDDAHIVCKRMLDTGYEIIEVKLPALITVVKGINNPRIPSLRGILKANRKNIINWSAEDIQADLSRCGMNGSPTIVKRTYQIKHEKNTEILKGNAPSLAKSILKIVSDNV